MVGSTFALGRPVSNTGCKPQSGAVELGVGVRGEGLRHRKHRRCRHVSTLQTAVSSWASIVRSRTNGLDRTASELPSGSGLSDRHVSEVIRVVPPIDDSQLRLSVAERG